MAPTPATTLAMIVGSVWLFEGVLLDCCVFPDPVRVVLGDGVSDAVIRVEVEVMEAMAGTFLVWVTTNVEIGVLAVDERSVALSGVVQIILEVPLAD